MRVDFASIKRSWLSCCLQVACVVYWLTRLQNTDSLYTIYIICGIAGVAAIVLCHKNPLTLQKRETIIIAAAAFLFSLAVTLANYSMIYPFRSMIIRICLMLLSGFVIGWNILRYLSRKIPLKRTSQRNNRKGKCTIIFFSAFAVFATINLLYLFFVAYPGTLTPDSLTQIWEIKNGYTSNHHPFWHTIVIAAFVKLGSALFADMNAAVATYSVASVLFMAFCFAYAITTVYRAGASKKVVIACTLLYALLPYHIAYSSTMWKDVVFGGAALLLAAVLFRVLKNIGNMGANLTGLFFCAVIFAIWRSNAWLALVAFVVCFGVYCVLSKRKMMKTVLVLCAVVLVSWVMRSPVLSMLSISQPDFVESLSIPVQQVARVIYEGRELSQEESDLLSQIMDIEEVPELYESHISDAIKNEIRSKDQEYLTENKGEYLKLWIKLGLKYPGDYLRAWIDQTRGYFNGGYSYWIYLTGVYENGYGIANTVESSTIQNVFQKYFDGFFGTVFTEPLRGIGLHIWVLCALFVVNLVNKREEMLLCIPSIMVVATLLIATPVFSEFRYAYSVFTTLPFLMVVCLTSTGKKESEQNG